MKISHYNTKFYSLIEQLGVEGYGILHLLNELLTKQPDNRYSLDLLPALAIKYKTTHKKLLIVILNYGFFKVDKNYFYL